MTHDMCSGLAGLRARHNPELHALLHIWIIRSLGMAIGRKAHQHLIPAMMLH